MYCPECGRFMGMWTLPICIYCLRNENNKFCKNGEKFNKSSTGRLDKTNKIDEYFKYGERKLDESLINKYQSVGTNNGISKKDYKVAPLTFAKPITNDPISESDYSVINCSIDSLIIKESPLSLDYASFRIIQLLNVNENESAKSAIRHIILSNFKISKSVSGKEIVWSQCQNPLGYNQFRCRSKDVLIPIAELSLEELKNSLKFTMDSPDDDTVVCSALLLLGYSSVSKNDYDLINNVLQSMKNQ